MYFFSNSPVMCLLTKVVLPTPPSPMRTTLNSATGFGPYIQKTLYVHYLIAIVEIQYCQLAVVYNLKSSLIILKQNLHSISVMEAFQKKLFFLFQLFKLPGCSIQIYMHELFIFCVNSIYKSLIFNFSLKMHKNQKLRLIQQIGFMLQLPQPAVCTVLQFYRRFTETVKDEKYANQIVVCSCIFLVSKIFQDERKIRDILNVINSAIKLYNLASNEGQSQQNESSNYISFNKLLSQGQKSDSKVKNKIQSILKQIQPTYQLTMYNQLKKQVLEAEQLLLRVLNFDFSIAEQKSSNFKQLLVVCDQLRLPQSISQIAVNAYNDLQINDQVVQWIPGLIYFAVEVKTSQFKLLAQQKNRLSDNGENHKSLQKIQSKNQDQSQQKELSLKVQKSQTFPQDLSFKKAKSDGELLKGQAQQLSLLQTVQWEKLFLVPVKKFKVYSEKVISMYEKLTKQENEQQKEEAEQKNNNNN